MNEEAAVYDGNTLAGPLSDVFAVELTTAAGRCRICGTTSQVATFRVYGPARALWDAARIVRTSAVGYPPCGSQCQPTLPQRPTNKPSTLPAAVWDAVTAPELTLLPLTDLFAH
jgi:Family of unknown function (DUF6510)